MQSRMSRQGLMWLAACVMSAGQAPAQNPVTAYPKNYKLVLDNPDVAVIRAHYGPHESVGVHDHSDFTTVYVYLNDSGQVKFVHSEEKKPFTVYRPPTHTGAFRVSPGRKETHTVENLADTPSDYLRVELKKMPIQTLKDEFRGPAPAQPLLTAKTVAYDNPALRIERMICDPGTTCTLDAEAAPSVLIAVTPTALLGEKQGQMLTFDQPTAWLAAGSHAGVRSVGPVPAQVLRIVLLKQ
jgi:hypothetical protein